MQDKVQALEFEAKLCSYSDCEQVTCPHASVSSSVKWGDDNKPSFLGFLCSLHETRM